MKRNLKDRLFPIVLVAIPVVVFVVFFILKLAAAISWSWWWVFSPFWIAIVLAAFAAIVVAWVIRVVELDPQEPVDPYH